MQQQISPGAKIGHSNLYAQLVLGDPGNNLQGKNDWNNDRQIAPKTNQENQHLPVVSDRVIILANVATQT